MIIHLSSALCLILFLRYLSGNLKHKKVVRHFVVNLSFNYSFRFTEFGGPVPYRHVEDLAFSVARFIQKGGSFINYYMVNNFFFFCISRVNPVLVSFRLISCVIQFLVLCFQYHGGTNFGRTSGGPFIATSYDYDAPLDEFGKHTRSLSYTGLS